MKIATSFASSVTKLYGQEKGYQMLADAGFQGIDQTEPMNLYRPFSGLFAASDEEFISYFEKERDAMVAAGLECCQVHVPFPTYPEPRQDATWTQQEEYEFMKSAIKRSFVAARILKSEYAVLHCAMRCGWGRDDDPDQTFALNLALFQELLPVAKQNGVKIALENMPNGWIPSARPQSLIAMIDAVGDPENFVACLDTGHANLAGEGVTPASYVRALGSRLKVLHVHDNDGVSDRHAIPFSGVTDWEDFAAALKEVGFNGVLSLEALFSEDALKQDAQTHLAQYAAAANKIASFLNK